MTPQPYDDQHAFIDIISNTLGVLILITLLSIILSGELSETEVELKPADRLTIDIHPPRRDLFLSKSNYYIAINQHIVPWPVEAIGKMLLEQRDLSAGSIDIGEFLFLDYTEYGDRPGYLPADADCYNLSLTPDPKAIVKLPPPDIDTLAAKIGNDYREKHIIPLFFVYPSGMNIFSKIHRRLAEGNIRLRWVPTSEKKDVNIYRLRHQYSDYYLKR